MFEGSAKICAKLVLVPGLLSLIGAVGEEGVGVEHGVAEIFVRFAMECVRTGSGAHIDHAAGVITEFRGVVVGLRVELLHHVLIHDQLNRVAVGRIDWCAIHEHGTLVGVSAINLVVAGGEYILTAQVAVGTALRHHARHQCDKRQNVAAIEWQRLNRFSFDGLAERSAIGLHDWRGRVDRNHLALLANFHGNVDASHLVDNYIDWASREALKAVGIDVDFVFAARERKNLVVALVVRCGISHLACGQIGYCDVRLSAKPRPIGR